VTLPDKPRGRGRELAQSELVRTALSHDVDVLQPTDAHGAEHLAKLRLLAPEVLVVASYGVILKPTLLDLAPRGALNVHASLLPRWRGASPIQAAILAGDEVTGVSIQRIVPALDEGDVLMAVERRIGERETAGDLFAALALLGGEALVGALDSLEVGSARFTPQDPAKATYARKLTKDKGAIDWTRSAQELERHVRAMNPWPGARFCDPQGREITLLEARVVAGGVDETGESGAVLDAKDRLVVACGTGALELVTVLPAGKRAMSGAEFSRGARVAARERLSAPRAN